MGDPITTRLELEHRSELKSIASKVAHELGADMFDTHRLYTALLNECNARKVWLVPAEKVLAK